MLTDKDHPQATSCKPIYHGKPVICNSFSKNQHGDYKQNDMASCAEALLYKDSTKSERNLFCVSVDFFFHKITRTNVAVLIRRVTCKKKTLSCEIYLGRLRPCFFHGGALVYFSELLRPSQQLF